MKLCCQRCGVETAQELGFCLSCRASLIPKNTYDLKVSDFAYGPDLDAMRSINVMGALPYLIRNLTFANLEKTMISNLSSVGRKVMYPTDLDSIIRRCAVLLSLERLPEVFIVEGAEMNAFTIGNEEQAYLVIDGSLLNGLTELELTAVIAHELGHVKSGHVMYHTLAEALAGGISLSTALIGVNVLSFPVRLAFLSWHRQSEVTADRASILVVNDINVIRSLLTKLIIARGAAPLELAGNETRNTGILDTAAGLFRTHPIDNDRFKLAKQFWESQEFSTVKRKIIMRERMLKGLMTSCRFCAEGKSLEDLFCPKCGRCQT